MYIFKTILRTQEAILCVIKSLNTKAFSCASLDDKILIICTETGMDNGVIS